MLVTHSQLVRAGAKLSHGYLWKLCDSEGSAVLDNGSVLVRFNTDRIRKGVECKIYQANRNVNMARSHRSNMETILTSIIKAIDKLEGNKHEK